MKIVIGGRKLKATGIVRRIDDLGRIVIPKEIRRTLRIREGDPLEIFTDGGGEVIFKKYSPVGELSSFSLSYAETIAKISGNPCVICDREYVIAAAGIPKKEVLERRVTPALDDLTEERKTYAFLKKDQKQLKAIEGISRSALCLSPIITNGDVCGSVVILQAEEEQTAKEADIALSQSAALFLGKTMEE